MKDTQWKLPRGETVVPPALLDAGCSPLLAAVFYARGIDTGEKAREFLLSGPENLGDPWAMQDMDRAAARIRRALADGEHVAVYGDYDVDGITSSCMLTAYLRARGLRCELYIPGRMEEGYGVNARAVETLAGKGVTLIVTVDCGVTAVEETEYARSLGVDMIITDHHECRETLPPAAAVVDPKRPDCGYPGQELAGVGVAFKLLCALEGDAEAVLDRYADLVAVGTIADVMPLTGENRYIVRRGLEKLKTGPRPGLRALIEEAGLGEKKLSAASVGFTLSPRLNASGRLDHAEVAVSLLLTGDPREAAERAEELCRLNRDRQALETGIWQDAVEMLAGAETAPAAPIVLSSERWHQGVVGIAASRLTEAYNVPAVMICLDGEKGKGSCRSCAGFNLFEALSACGEYLEGFGGHALAAGLTIRRENVDAFRAALADYYRAHPPTEEPTLEIDLCADRPELLRMECVEDLDRMEPCGTANPRPRLALLGARLAEATPIGGGKHLRFRLEKFGQSWEAVWFGRSAGDLSVRVGDWVDAAFAPQINEFRGRKSVQLLLADLRPHDTTAGSAILNGEIAAAAGFLPVREDCVLAWRGLTARGGRCAAPLPALNEALAPQLREEKLCAILKVFEELGLLTLSFDGDIVTAACVPGAPKADLGSSMTLKRLKELADQ